MDASGRTWETAVGLTRLVNWSHMRAEAEKGEVSMKKKKKTEGFFTTESLAH